MYFHWEQCREVIEESVVCVCVNCYQTTFFLTQVIFFIYQSTTLSVYIYIYIYIWKIKYVEKVIVFYIFLDNVSCEEFAM